MSAHFDALGFPLNNVRNSWGALSPRGILLRIWADEIVSERVMVLGPPAVRELQSKRANGFWERVDHLRLLWSGGIAGYALVLTATDVNAVPRQVKDFNREYVREIVALDEAADGSIWAELGEPVSVSKLEKHAVNHRLLPASGAFPTIAKAKSMEGPGKKLGPTASKLPALRNLLIDLAKTRRTYTNEEARTPLGLGTLGMTNALRALGRECVEAGEPVLTSLIVRPETGRCADGFYKEFRRDDAQEREACYAFWGAPEEGDQLSSAPDDSLRQRAQRFALVATRPEQQAFRNRLFIASGGRCIVTGCDIDAALDAAHRHGRDWRQGHNRAGDGWLLRRDVHRLYDAGLLRISDDGIRVEVDEEIASHYGQFAR
ncbi:HNH endonuclease [Lysobacter yangpyeongensis]|uniref:HNH endonuclease n=1 Tax=Lysobacter yangpyeongensis TaxID=346182 RepID=A0ABW0SQB0_9GAMM